MDTLIMIDKIDDLMLDFNMKWNDRHPGQKLSEDLQSEFHQYLLMSYVVGVDHTVEKIESEIKKITNYPFSSIHTKKIKQIINNL